jgi:ACS family D-galactonate transporter-like MFS transporter
MNSLRFMFGVRHRVLAVLCLMYFVAYVDRVNISIAAGMMRREFGLSATELGFVFSAFAYPYAAMQIAGGWLSDRFGPRRVLALLSIVWAAGTILTGISWGIASLVVFRLLVGIGEGGAFPTATRALTYWMPVAERGFAQGIVHAFARLGGAATPPVVLALVAASGWRASFVALGGVSLLWTVLWLLVFRNTPVEHPAVGDTERDELARATVSGLRSSSGRTPWRALVSRMWLVTFVDFCYGWSLWMFLTWLPSYLSEARGFNLDSLAIMTMLPLSAGVAGDALGGFLSDAIYRRTGNLRAARVGIIVAGLLGAFAFIVPAARTASPQGAVYALAAAFFCLELTNAAIWALPIDIAGPYAGTAGGMMNTGFGIAGMISPVVFGMIIQRTGRYDLPFLISAGLLLLGAGLATLIDPTRTIEDAESTMTSGRQAAAL